MACAGGRALASWKPDNIGTTWAGNQPPATVKV